MIKYMLSIPLKSLQKFINSVFKLSPWPLLYPHCSCVSKRDKTVNITLKIKNKGSIQHLTINSTRFKVCSERKWKVKKHGLVKNGKFDVSHI
ncbi:Mobile element protein [Candidatus Enterovibrio altilux]|uniref:Mobile element protein n=1 Tax=Candidatus Enterovibrio altilux TaxID=1927128 RepID=A0A291B9F8_9GAMM|nr:Mobile element protein [Candidatus Enterovibrio luxaltus]